MSLLLSSSHTSPNPQLGKNAVEEKEIDHRNPHPDFCLLYPSGFPLSTRRAFRPEFLRRGFNLERSTIEGLPQAFCGRGFSLDKSTW